MALILGMDTSMSACSVALIADGQTITHAPEEMTRGQSEALAPMIDRVMIGHDYADLDAVAVTRGPGAFTGLRIGLAAARRLAMTIDRPCLGISTFDVLSLQVMQNTDVVVPSDGIIVIAIETKRDDFYIQAIGEDGSFVIPPAAMMAEDIRSALPEDRPLFIAGDGWSRLHGELGPEGPAMREIPNVVLPDAAVLAKCAQAFVETPDDAPTSPLYLRPPDVTMPKKAE